MKNSHDPWRGRGAEYPPASRNRDRGTITPCPDGNQEEADMASRQLEQSQQINETGSVTPTKGKHVIHCLTIVGQVEGHFILSPQNKTTKYEHVIPQLVSIQENPDIEGMLVILNTVGGDVEAGLAIAELISGMKKPTVSLVLGGGHSIGVPLAVSAKRSFIAPSATMTLHPVRMNGTVLGVPQTMSYFEKMQDRILGFVEENSNMSRKQFRQMMMNTGELVMDMGTVLTGRQAVEVGLINHVGGLSDAIECLYSLIEENQASRERSDRPDSRESGGDQPPTRKARQGQTCGRPQLRQGDIRPGGGRSSANSRARRQPRRIVARPHMPEARSADTEQAAPRSPGGTGLPGHPQYTSGSATGRERQNRPPQGRFTPEGGYNPNH